MESVVIARVEPGRTYRHHAARMVNGQPADVDYGLWLVVDIALDWDTGRELVVMKGERGQLAVMTMASFAGKFRQTGPEKPHPSPEVEQPEGEPAGKTFGRIDQGNPW
jgi:hypothetical protein